MSDLFNAYVEQIKADLDINQINILEMARKLPSRRHFWTAKLINHKITINSLERQKMGLIKQVSERLQNGSPVGLETRTVTKAAEQSDEIRAINEKISEGKLIVEFLEHVQKNFFTATYDIKNVLEGMKMEQL